ncbi:hypothetical protein [Flavobacterium frigidarium]|uniref:Uncharacterized protein n=1 Tax=Flavobacterium frigidarium TaxID=99286 RepID=A0ABV4KAI9_9FLAO
MIEKLFTEIAKEGFKEISKGISEGLKEGFKGGADKLSEGFKEKYLQKETPAVSEISENIPSELKDISKDVSEIENKIDFKPEAVVENKDSIKVDLDSIHGKLNDFVNGFKENLTNNVSVGKQADHLTDKGLDIAKDVNTYITDIKERLNQVGIDVDKIMEHLNSAQGTIDETDLEESDFDESE